MSLRAAEIQEICSQRSDLAAYLDGELTLREELALDAHLAACAACRTELNEQKNLLRVLDFALENEKDFELPENFTKIVVANAESKVSGLRRPQERSKALIVCAVLFALGVLGLGRETAAIFNTFSSFAEQFLVVAGFVFHLFYDIALGAAIILRSLGSMLISDATVAAMLAITFFVFSLLALRRLMLRSPRLKIQTQEK